MTALHYACQRTTDVELVRTVLSHKKDNINVRTKDGMTALDLISARTRVTTQTQGMFAIELKQQEEIIQLIRNNGGKSGSMPTADHIVEHMNGTHNGMMDYPAQNMGYPVHGTGSMASSSPPHSVSPWVPLLLSELEHNQSQNTLRWLPCQYLQPIYEQCGFVPTVISRIREHWQPPLPI
eukprot:TRINITY_DN7042_c0_g1_i1.p1 TRINITY_DN7042_c0_g1~~TRINITY_DN7042_c0_g1_i1.p1  ORF type:complete len:192 (+),score=35.48 TRINITY_DN7042_c0_g1_i1:38-577(+)